MKVLPDNPNDYLAPSKKTDAQKYDAREALESASSTSIGFTSGGNPEQPCPTCEVDSPDCYAKKVTIDSPKFGLRDEYYIKVGPNGVAFDPWGTFTEGSQNKFAKIQGKAMWNFVQTSKRAFEFYKTFLQTRNRAWKINAEREMVNSYESTRKPDAIPTRSVKFIGGKR